MGKINIVYFEGYLIFIKNIYSSSCSKKEKCLALKKEYSNLCRIYLFLSRYLQSGDSLSLLF